MVAAKVRCAKRVLVLLWLLIVLTSSQTLLALEHGAAAPDFSLPVINSAELGEFSQASQRARYPLLSLSDYRGKVIYLDFWDTSCAPCRQSLPLLSRMRNEFYDRDVEVIGVNLDQDPRAALRFLESFPTSYPVVSDPAALSAKQYEISGLPTAFLITKTGAIESVHKGFKQEDINTIRSEISRLLAEAQATDES